MTPVILYEPIFAPDGSDPLHTAAPPPITSSVRARRADRRPEAIRSLVAVLRLRRSATAATPRVARVAPRARHGTGTQFAAIVPHSCAHRPQLAPEPCFRQ